MFQLSDVFISPIETNIQEVIVIPSSLQTEDDMLEEMGNFEEQFSVHIN